jgi:anti-sigma regulatory factor (Ser/Thr protein kinase)
VAISDDGVAFNPLAVKEPDTDASLDQRQIGGLGLQLVRNLMDEVTYQRRIESNFLTLVVYVGKIGP